MTYLLNYIPKKNPLFLIITFGVNSYGVIKNVDIFLSILTVN